MNLNDYETKFTESHVRKLQGKLPAESVAQVLRQTEYPNIVSSTITALYNEGLEQSRRYSGLAGRLIRRSIDEG